jgi:glycosyltransferase involved in cell wall biosynthesis
MAAVFAGASGHAAYQAQFEPGSPKPRIAIVTPTRNRPEHLPYQAAQLRRQNYPLDRITWVITDSSDTVAQSWVDAEGHLVGTGITVVHKFLAPGTPLGESRNVSLELACAADPRPEYIFFMDDDDIVGANRIKRTLRAFEIEGAGRQVAGCSRVLVFLLRGETLVEIASFTELHGGGIQHALEPTLAVTREYAETHFFDPADPRGLLSPFLEGFTVPIIPLRAEDVCVIIGHDTSTFDKYQLADPANKKRFNVRAVYEGYGIERLWDDWQLGPRLRHLFLDAHGASMEAAEEIREAMMKMGEIPPSDGIIY